MQHPNEATLALFAGQDLGFFARWRTARHLARCAACRGEVAQFAGVCEELAGLRELPELPWNRLAAEMKANIRLGLAAGECIRDPRAAADPAGFGWRAMVACASVAILLAAGVWLERPAAAPAATDGQISLRAAGDAVELSEGAQSLALTNPTTARDGSRVAVTYSAGAQGSMRARYVDPSTGVVTINTVYVQ